MINKNTSFTFIDLYKKNYCKIFYLAKITNSPGVYNGNGFLSSNVGLCNNPLIIFDDVRTSLLKIFKGT